MISAINPAISTNHDKPSQRIPFQRLRFSHFSDFGKSNAGPLTKPRSPVFYLDTGYVCHRTHKFDSLGIGMHVRNLSTFLTFLIRTYVRSESCKVLYRMRCFQSLYLISSRTSCNKVITNLNYRRIIFRRYFGSISASSVYIMKLHNHYNY